MDFVILDLNDKVEVPLILGRSFLATLQALIGVKDGRMVLRVDEEKIAFKLQEPMRHSIDFDVSCYFVNCIDDCIHDFVQDLWIKDELVCMVSEEEEPPGEIAQDEERQEIQDTPPSQKKCWKRVDSKKKKK